MVRHRGRHRWRTSRCERAARHWKTLTLVPRCAFNGLTATLCHDGAMDGPSSSAYVEQILAPTLRKATSSSWIPGALQRSTASPGRRRVGAKVRYLPAYSRPQFDRNAFSKLKTALRKGAARTVKTLMKLIASSSRHFAPEQCTNLLSTCRIHVVTHIKWKPSSAHYRCRPRSFGPPTPRAEASTLPSAALQAHTYSP